MRKKWEKLVAVNSVWEWRCEKLWHKNAPSLSKVNRFSIKSLFVKWIYADQNRVSNVKSAIGGIISKLGHDSIGINIGAGGTCYPGFVNIEISDGDKIDVITIDHRLPFLDKTIDVAILQEVLEHVADFNLLLDEIYRVLKPSGILYCQVPFQIGYHPGPADYWRFSRQALEHLFCEPKWKCEEIKITLGHGSGAYRILVEFIAVTMSCLGQWLYMPAKVASAVCLYPIKWFDIVTSYSKEKDRIPGGYFCIAKKLDSVTSV
jgi:SAM-dependent methyltransferase